MPVAGACQESDALCQSQSLGNGSKEKCKHSRLLRFLVFAALYAGGRGLLVVKPHMLESTCFLTWQMPWAALGSQTWSSADTRFP